MVYVRDLTRQIVASRSFLVSMFFKRRYIAYAMNFMQFVIIRYLSFSGVLTAEKLKIFLKDTNYFCKLQYELTVFTEGLLIIFTQ